MKPRCTNKITHEGWYYLFIFAMVFGGAVLRDVNLLVILGGMLAGPMFLSRHLALQTLRGLIVERRLPQAICAGDLLIVNLAITNTRKYLGSWILLLEEPIRRIDGSTGKPNEELLEEASVLFPYVPGANGRKGAYSGRLTRRGQYSLGPMRLSTRFPFGLVRYTYTCCPATTVTVLPRLGNLSPQWNARRHKSLAGSDRHEQRPGIEGDFFGLRTWQRGDNRRSIHWRTSARAGELMVRQFEQPRSRDVAVVLDLWQPDVPSEEHHDNIELAVSFAATLVAQLCRSGSSDVFLIAADPLPHATGGPGSTALLDDLMERLALVEPQARDVAAELLQKAAAEIEPGTEIIVVSTRAIQPESPEIVGKMPTALYRRLAGRHIRVVDTSSKELEQFFRATE